MHTYSIYLFEYPDALRIARVKIWRMHSMFSTEPRTTVVPNMDIIYAWSTLRKMRLGRREAVKFIEIQILSCFVCMSYAYELKSDYSCIDFQRKYSNTEQNQELDRKPNELFFVGF